MPLETDLVWKEEIKTIKAEHPRWGATLVQRELKAPGRRAVRRDVPSTKTVGRILKGLPEEELAEYRTFHWPRSMELAGLPWEASPAVLELLTWYDQRSPGRRPTVRIARWFWRVTLAAPDLALLNRCFLAEGLAVSEALGREPEAGLEWYLAYAPWRGETASQAFEDAASRPECSVPRFHPSSLTVTSSELVASVDAQTAFDIRFRTDLTVERFGMPENRMPENYMLGRLAAASTILAHHKPDDAPQGDQ